MARLRFPPNSPAWDCNSLPPLALSGSAGRRRDDQRSHPDPERAIPDRARAHLHRRPGGRTDRRRRRLERRHPRLGPALRRGAGAALAAGTRPPDGRRLPGGEGDGHRVPPRRHPARAGLARGDRAGARRSRRRGRRLPAPLRRAGLRDPGHRARRRPAGPAGGAALRGPGAVPAPRDPRPLGRDHAGSDLRGPRPAPPDQAERPPGAPRGARMDLGAPLRAERGAAAVAAEPGRAGWVPSGPAAREGRGLVPAEAVGVSASGIVTLLTDFGTRDGYVGALKGVILARFPAARVVDLAHELPPGDVAAASAVLGQSAPFFPAGTVHLAIVDPGVGTDRRGLALGVGGQLYVGPDNGIFSAVLHATGPLVAHAL